MPPVGKPPPAPLLKKLVREALREDLGRGDVTTREFLSGVRGLRAAIWAKQDGVVCGTPLAERAFREVGARTRVLVRDGRRVRRGAKVLEVRGPAALLSAERVALNFMGRLSGIATLTRAYVDRAGPVVFDTRKTTPLYRALEKYAVRCGGGRNHRLGLFDAAMLKDNHLAALGRGPERLARLREAARRFRRRHPGMELELEAQDRGELELALEVGADAVLLDNMAPRELAALIKLIRRRPRPPLVEISGGVRLEDVRALARLKPDRISIGRLTHSAPSVDFSLELL